METRYFNKIKVTDEGTVIKKSDDPVKIAGEWAWMTNKNILFKHPKVYSSDISLESGSYVMDFVKGRTMADLYLNRELSVEIFRQLLEIFVSVIDMERQIRFDISEGTDVMKANNYKSKTLSRLKDTEWRDSLEIQYTYNGTLLPALKDIVEKCNAGIWIKDISYIHGDLCFSNILIVGDCKQFDYAVIDPRGLSFDRKISALGDYRYDIAKLAHSVIGRYDDIKASRYCLEYDNKDHCCNIVFEDSEYNKGLQDIFYNIFGDKLEWYQIMVNLFLSMIPLHRDHPDHQIAMFVNALRLYDEMTKKFDI